MGPLKTPLLFHQVGHSWRFPPNMPARVPPHLYFQHTNCPESLLTSPSLAVPIIPHLLYSTYHTNYMTNIWFYCLNSSTSILKYVPILLYAVPVIFHIFCFHPYHPHIHCRPHLTPYPSYHIYASTTPVLLYLFCVYYTIASIVLSICHSNLH